MNVTGEQWLMQLNISTGLRNLRCHLFQAQDHSVPCLWEQDGAFSIQFWRLDQGPAGRTRNWPVRMRSMQFTTSSASSTLKHIGGLNLMTFSQGPSVLMQILSSSFSLMVNQKWHPHEEGRQSKSWICGVKSPPLHQQWCCFRGGGLLLSVCHQLSSHKQSDTSLKIKIFRHKSHPSTLDVGTSSHPLEQWGSFTDQRH